jgi:DNA-binding LacI/PurR family transcriptional regulator
VTSDNFLGGYEATVYLLKVRKCTRVHVIADREVFSSRERQDGSEKALSERHLSECRHPAQNRQGNAAAFRWAYQETADLLAADHFGKGDGIFALNDNLAAGCRAALNGANSSLPVIGFDGQHWGAYLSPPLETMFQDMNVMGARAAEVILRHMIAVKNPEHHRLPVPLRTEGDRMKERGPAPVAATSEE